MKKSLKLLFVLLAVIIFAMTGCGGNSGAQPAASAQSGTDVQETEFKILDEEPESAVPEDQTAEEPSGKDDDREEISEDEVSESEAAEEEKASAEETSAAEETADGPSAISESDTPSEKDELAAYIHEFGHLPDNFLTKNEAKELGWVSSKGNLWEVAPGCSIGGDRFTNYEGLLPEASGRKYTECDVGYDGGYRDARRIVFSNDGLIYYTDDHYESFELLYGDEG